MRRTSHEISNLRVLFLPLLLLVITAAGLTWLGVNPFWGKERVPFEDLRWKHGYAEVLAGGEWSKLLSVNGVKAERLIDRAIAEWGPAYQDRFVSGFKLLMEKENGGRNILCKLTVRSASGEKSYWSLSIPRRYWSCRDNIATRQLVNREPIRLARDVNLHSTRQVNSKFPNDNSEWLAGADALADLRYFEWSLERRYAYLAKSKTAYQTLVNDIFNDIQNGISRRDFAIRLERILVLFDDIHTRVSFGASRIRLGENSMPGELVEVDGKIAYLNPGRLSYFDPDYPFLKDINNVPLLMLQSKLTGLARKETGASGYSPEVIKYLRMTELLMALTEQPFDGQASITLESADGKSTRKTTLPCVPAEINPDFTFPVESRILKGATGYLALRKRMFPDENFRKEIVNAMTGLQHTNGMILDLRGNAGGHREAIPLVLQYFIPPDELPTLLSVAAVRMDSETRPPMGAELLQSRRLWSKSWNGWTAMERQVIQDEMKRFIPTFSLREEMFSELYYMVVGSQPHSRAYHYDKKVIVLHDNETASAAGLLLSALKGKKNIQLMGSTSNSDSGYPLAYQLPHSKIVYWLSSMVSFKPDGSLLDNVEPDISYKLTLDDLNQMITHRDDPLIAKAAELLQK